MAGFNCRFEANEPWKLKKKLTGSGPMECIPEEGRS
jgi:hypothetical protein